MKFQVCFLLTFFFLSCESEERIESSRELVEVFPSVNLKDYDTIQFEDKVEFIIPYEYSISNASGKNQVLSYSHLVDEVSIDFYQYAKNEVQKSVDSREVYVGKDSLFIFFTNEAFVESTNKFKEFTNQENYFSKVNDLKTRYYRVTGISHGYPFEQSLSIRFYEDTEFFYALYFKSLSPDADELSDVEDAVMLSLKCH